MRDAIAIAAAVRGGRTTAAAVVETSLAALAADPHVAVTRLLAARARRDAAAVDAQVAGGHDPGPLAGVPFGVKDLFDVAGEPTTAGSAIYADAPPAHADAQAVARLCAAGAIPVATLNMDEFAYGFATINARHGTTRNPHDPARLAGGSSGGSAAVVAAGLLPLALGSDTNGSIRVPAGLTGIYGLKPTHGTLPCAGMFPFAESFDDPGPMAATLADLRLAWGLLSGRAAEPDDAAPIRFAGLGGRFRDNADPDQVAAIDAIAGAAAAVTIPDIARARSAAFVVTAAEGGALHRAALARDPLAFDPATRDRLIAGALLPPAIREEALAFRDRFRAAVLALFADHDVLIAPATPCVAPAIDDPRIMIDGRLSPARADLGIHTQPISFAGLPALSVPLARAGRLPLGLQLIGRPGAEPLLFRAAGLLEKRGIVAVTMPCRERADAVS